MRRPLNATLKGKGRGKIIDAISIRERPAEVSDRSVPGHWEGDLLSGSGNSHIATLVERASRYTVLVKVGGKDTASVVSGLVREVRKLPKELKKTLAWDRGMELASHKRFQIETQVAVFFADPQSPWQRGSNENTNGLLRQYFLDGTNLAEFTQGDLNAVARRLNGRPRKTLSYRTPADTLDAILQSSAESTAAFFKISRSSRSDAFSRRSRRFSCSRVSVRHPASSSFSSRIRCFQFCKSDALIPRSRATFVRLRSPAIVARTASTLNSALYDRRCFPKTYLVSRLFANLRGVSGKPGQAQTSALVDESEGTIAPVIMSASPTGGELTNKSYFSSSLAKRLSFRVPRLLTKTATASSEMPNIKEFEDILT